jgi:hypothetical protein
MPNGTAISKAGLRDRIERAISTLEDAYRPEANRADMAEAVRNALDILKDGNKDDDDSDKLEGIVEEDWP